MRGWLVVSSTTITSSVAFSSACKRLRLVSVWCGDFFAAATLVLFVSESEVLLSVLLSGTVAGFPCDVGLPSWRAAPGFVNLEAGQVEEKKNKGKKRNAKHQRVTRGQC